MSTCHRTNENGTLVTILGPLDETARFDDVVQENITLNVAEVRRANFLGVNALVARFSNVDHPTDMVAVPSELLLFFRLFPALLDGLQIRSLLATFFCDSCDEETHREISFERESLFAIANCEKCSAKLEIDSDVCEFAKHHWGQETRSEGTRQVLVAEDDQMDREWMVRAWSEVGAAHDLTFVGDGQALLDHLSTARDTELPALLLLDLNMPKIDGREALEHIRSDKRYSGMPIIVLTTSEAEPDIIQAYESGANSFITKPTRYRDLLRLVTSLSSFWLKTPELRTPGGRQSSQ